MYGVKFSLIVKAWTGILYPAYTREEAEKLPAGERADRTVKFVRRGEYAEGCPQNDSAVARSNLFSVETVGEHMVWAPPMIAEEIREIEETIEALRKKRARLLERAFEAGQPVTEKAARQWAER